MATDQNKKSGFGGIFDGISRVIMKEEYLQQIHENTPDNETADGNKSNNQFNVAAAAVQTAPVQTQQSGSEVDLMIKKIYAAFENMNQPGIDFLELWNAVEAMGGITEQNFIQAYKVLNIGAGNMLTVAGIISSGEHYVEELKLQIEDGINAKKAERIKLVDQQHKEKESLTAETISLTKQIQELQKQLLDKQQRLAQLDANYIAPIAVIDKKINVGTAALAQVLNQLQGAIDLFKKINLS